MYARIREGEDVGDERGDEGDVLGFLAQQLIGGLDEVVESPRRAQCFLSAHRPINNLFRLCRPGSEAKHSRIEPP